MMNAHKSYGIRREEMRFRQTLMKYYWLLVLVLAFIPSVGANSYDERTQIVRHSCGRLAKSFVSWGGRKNYMQILKTALRQSCKCALLLHGHLAAVVQIFVFVQTVNAMRPVR